MKILFFIIPVLALLNLVYEYKRVLMMLQQNSYRNERYMRWLRVSGDTTTFMRMFAYIVLFVSLISAIPHNFSMYLILLVSAVSFGKLFTAKYKKPIVFTKRVWRLFATMLLLTLILMIAAFCVTLNYGLGTHLFVQSLLLLALYAGSHIMLMFTNTLLSPVEKAINRRYYNDAARILSQMPDLKIIGITGSYGKTSTKHYLQRILSEKFDVLMTPGSYNTTLGVVRTVRELLKPYNEVFIVEMGAKQPGDIKEI